MSGRSRQVGKVLIRYEDDETPKGRAVVTLCEILDTCFSSQPCQKKLEQLDDALARIKELFPRGKRADLAVVLGLAKQKVATWEEVIYPKPKGFYGAYPMS
jgi:hypothetical protein